MGLPAISVSVLLGGVAFLGLTEALFYMAAPVKIIFILILFAISSGIAFVLNRQMDIPSFTGFYRNFARRFDLSGLGDALDLHFDNRRSTALTSAAIRQNLKKLNPQKTGKLFSRYLQEQQWVRAANKGFAAFSISGLLLLTSIVFQPDAFNRLAHAWENFSPPNPYTYNIEPGDITLEQGDTFVPVVRFEGESPDNVSLAFKTDIEDDFRNRSPVTMAGDSAAFPSVSLNTSGRYYIVMDGFVSDEYSVNIQLRPRFEQLELTVIPPSYTNLDTLFYSYPFSKIQAHYGSEILIKSIVNKPVGQVEILRTSEEDTLLSPDASSSRTYTYNWKLTNQDTVSFRMADSAGLNNKNSFRFVTEPREDKYPFVDLIEPQADLKMKSAEVIDLQYEADDDFGLTSGTIGYEVQRAFSDRVEKNRVNLSKPVANELQSYSWDLPSLDLKPRDIITYWVEVGDNDPFKGPKISRTQKRTITLSSMAEYLDELDAQESDVSETLEEVSDSFEQVQQEYERFKEQLKENPDADWEQKQSLEQVKKQQEDVDSKVEELNEKFEQMRREIEKNEGMSPETTKAYSELQKLMEEINDPELQKALDELQKSLEDINPGQLQKALEDYEFNEQLYKERIERTMELFKSLKLNSDLDKLSMTLDELSKQEQQLSESEQSPARDAQQQKSVAEDLEKLKKQLTDLDKNTPAKAEKQVRELQDDAGEKIEDIDKQLQQNIDELNKQEDSSSSSPETKEQQREIGRQMDQLSKQMQDARQQLNSQSRNINIAALEYILHSLINLSENQEKLTRETGNIPDRSQAFIEKAREERNIAQQFSSLSDSLYRVSSEVPAFSNRINQKKTEVENRLSDAVEQLAERSSSGASYLQRESLGGINEIASMIASLLDQMQNQQGGGGSGTITMQQFLEQMKQMSGDQQQLNQEIDKLINDIQGDRLSNEQMERLNQLARQQNKIRKQLQELQKNGQLESGDRILSELERMSEEMEDAINEIRGGQLDDHLVKRQQNILSRMLNAEDALEERGEEERREATTAEERQQRVSPEVTMEELQKKIRKMLNDPDRTKFTDDYQRLIEQYFELLREIQ